MINQINSTRSADLDRLSIWVPRSTTCYVYAGQDEMFSPDPLYPTSINFPHIQEQNQTNMSMNDFPLLVYGLVAAATVIFIYNILNDNVRTYFSMCSPDSLVRVAETYPHGGTININSVPIFDIKGAESHPGGLQQGMS